MKLLVNFLDICKYFYNLFFILNKIILTQIL